MTTRFFSRNSLVTFGSLILASIVCLALSLARFYRTGHIGPIFLAWNLFLAWVPFVYAYIAYRLHKSHFHKVLIVPGVFGCALIWLLFLPNAPYLLTDLIHLRVVDNSLYWYDLLMLLWYAWTGFLLGIISLYLMQQVVADSFGKALGWLFVVVTLSLTSFGVYLGRFLRWNSWDVLADPFPLFADIYNHFRHPAAHIQSHIFWIILAVFLCFTYITLTTFAPLQTERSSAQ
jgi:uncharacterized membrane protein